MSFCKNMDPCCTAETLTVGETYFCIPHLSLFRFSAKLSNHLEHLCHACSPKRVSLREQTTAGIHCDYPSQFRHSFLDEFSTSATIAEAKIFVVDYLCYREAVV